MEKYANLKKDDARSGTSKKYWIESAKSLGFIDTLTGIKLSVNRPPPLPAMSSSQKTEVESSRARRSDEDFYGCESNAKVEKKGDADGENEKEEKEGGGGEVKVKNEEGSGEASDNSDGSKPDDKDKDGKSSPKKEPSDAPPLVIPADKGTATSFSFLLLSQMQPCVFTEADRLGKRKGLPTGFAGLACRHCFGGYGSGRFFPSSIKTLSDTSKTLNVLHNHMIRCRKCPKDVRDELEKVRSSHDAERSKMKFGSQKAFFAKIWSRLHDNRPDDCVLKRGVPPVRIGDGTIASSNGLVRQQHRDMDIRRSSGNGNEMSVGSMMPGHPRGMNGMNMMQERMQEQMMMRGMSDHPMMSGMGGMMGGFLSPGESGFSPGMGMSQESMGSMGASAMGGGMASSMSGPAKKRDHQSALSMGLSNQQVEEMRKRARMADM